MADQPPSPLVENIDAAKAVVAQAIGKIVQGYGPEEVAKLLSLLQTQTAPAPEVRDLFEIVSDPGDIPAAIFRGAPAKEVAPYDVPYIEGGEGVSNLQGTLYERLLESGGGLLVQSRAGVGKTREVAELAKRLCADEGWTVCIAKGEGDARIDAPAAFPDALRARRLLFVIDDLHRRAVAGVQGQAPYLGRLHSFLEFFAKSMAPSELYVIATARSEPHHRVQLGFDPSDPLWGRFKVYNLPEFTLPALRSALLRLAEAQGVALDEAGAQQMVANSDRTLRTILDNVTRAQRRNEPLTRTNWSPTQGKSWDLRYREAAAHWPGVEGVYHALHLLREAGLPTRFAYIVGVGSRLRAADVTTAAKGLVDMGLLALQGELLDAFADEQLRDSLQNSGKGLPQLSDNWTCIIEQTVAEAKEHPEWSQDLVSLTSILLMIRRFIDAELTSTTAIACRKDDAAVYCNRALARVGQKKWAGAEEDFDKAIERGRDDAAVYLGRGFARVVQKKWAGAEEDLSKAMERGQDDTGVYLVRGVARVMQQKWAEADEDLSKAVERGHDDAVVYFARGGARAVQEKWAGAEGDFSKAIERGQDDADVYYARGGARGVQEKWAGAVEDFDKAIERGQDDTVVYFARGVVRSVQKNWAGAVEDFSKAIERGRDDAVVYFVRGVARVGQKNWAGAEGDLSKAIERGQGDADVYYKRGGARLLQAKWAGAEEDFSKAIKGGQGDAAVRLGRAFARVRLGRFSEAQEDCEQAEQRAPSAPSSHACWGYLHLARREYDAAIFRYEAALKLGPQPSIYFELGLALLLCGRIAEAEDAYSRGLVAASGADIKGALAEINFWSVRHHDRAESSEATEAIAKIRQQLETVRKTDHLDG